MVNRIWPIAVAGEADSVSSVSASACHIGGPNSVNPGQILLVYGTSQEEEPTSHNDLAASRVGKTKANSWLTFQGERTVWMEMEEVVMV